jgi:hypothetical protein
MKTCRRCQKSKPLNKFHKGYLDCIKCLEEKRSEQRAWEAANPEASKKCSRCKVIKSITEFTPGYHRCKKCNAEVSLERREVDRKSDPDTLKRCFKCGVTKPLREFHPGSWCKKCYIDHHYKDHLERPERYLLHNAKYRATKNNLPMDLTENDIHIPEFCPDLGLRLEPASGRVRPNSPTIDRIIPKLGYIKGNVRVVSSQSNRMKQETSILQSASIWSNVLDSLPEGYTLDAETCDALRNLARAIQEVLSTTPPTRFERVLEND